MCENQALTIGSLRQRVLQLTDTVDKLTERVVSITKRMKNYKKTDHILQEIDKTIDFIVCNDQNFVSKFDLSGKKGLHLIESFEESVNLEVELGQEFDKLYSLISRINKISIILATYGKTDIGKFMNDKNNKNKNGCAESCHSRNSSNESIESIESVKSNASNTSQKSENSVNSVNSSNSTNSTNTNDSNDSNGSNDSACTTNSNVSDASNASNTSSISSTSSEHGSTRGKKYLEKIIRWYNGIVLKNITKEIDNKGKSIKLLNEKMSHREIGKDNSMQAVLCDLEYLNEKITNAEYYIDQCGHFWS